MKSTVFLYLDTVQLPSVNNVHYSACYLAGEVFFLNIV